MVSRVVVMFRIALCSRYISRTWRSVFLGVLVPWTWKSWEANKEKFILAAFTNPTILMRSDVEVMRVWTKYVGIYNFTMPLYWYGDLWRSKPRVVCVRRTGSYPCQAREFPLACLQGIPSKVQVKSYIIYNRHRAIHSTVIDTGIVEKMYK
jgi:hypothetical protein